MLYLKTGLSWFDDMVEDLDGHGNYGLPDHSWIMLSGKPGSGKTTVGLVLANALSKRGGLEVEYFNCEMSENKRESMCTELGLTTTNWSIDDSPDTSVLMARLLRLGQKAKEEGTTVIIFLDSLQAVYNPSSMKEANTLALQLEELKKNYPVIIITVGHLNKGGQYAGPARFRQACDVAVDIYRDKSGFFHLDTSQKNRFYKPFGASHVKLARTPEGLVQSVEPDFISNNSLVAGVRNLWRKR
jgi:predicted ATP-dependent serine protease